VVGGTLGGTLGGQLGGQVGGSGDKPMRVGGDVNPPVAVKRVDPIYPDVARKARIEGMVILETIIDRDGNVTDVRVLKGLPLGLDQSAVDAVKRWKFKPGTLNGQAVPVIFTLTVNFTLH
jgi:protein TonB